GASQLLERPPAGLRAAGVPAPAASDRCHRDLQVPQTRPGGGRLQPGQGQGSALREGRAGLPEADAGGDCQEPVGGDAGLGAGEPANIPPLSGRRPPPPSSGWSPSPLVSATGEERGCAICSPHPCSEAERGRGTTRSVVEGGGGSNFAAGQRPKP